MSTLKDLHRDYAHVLPIAVKWGEMDAFQHVNNTIYIRYLEDGRLAVFEKLGLVEEMNESKKGPIFASVTCDYLAPVTYPDTVHVATNIKQSAPKKIEIEQVIYSEQMGKLAARSTSLCVYYDYAELGSCEVPQSIAQALLKLNS